MKRKVRSPSQVPVNAVPGNLVLGTHLPRLRQAPLRREKVGGV